MFPYFKLDGAKCNAELVVLNPSKKLVFTSVVDYRINVDKLFAELVTKRNTVTLKDHEDADFREYLYNYRSDREENYRMNTGKFGSSKTHAIIKSTNIKDYVFNWAGGLKEFKEQFKMYLTNVMFLPIVQDTVDFLLVNNIKNKYRLFEKCKVYSNNAQFDDLEVYHINQENVLKALKKLVINVLETPDKKQTNWEEINTISEYLIEFANEISQKLKRTTEILYKKGDYVCPDIFEGDKKPYDGQVPIIQGALNVFERGENYVFLASEQGIGKTPMSVKITHALMKNKKKNYITLITAPAITLTQWEQEIKENIREDVDVIIIKKTSDFIKLYSEKRNGTKRGMANDKPLFIIVGKETLKLGGTIKPCYLTKNIIVSREVDTGYCSNRFKTVKSIETVLICPSCYKPLENNDDGDKKYFLSYGDFDKPKKSNYKCSCCGEVLWQSYCIKTPKTSVKEFIKKKKINFDMLIVDEAHEGNNAESLIGSSTTFLMTRAKYKILASGTTNEAYASSMYNILNTLERKKLQEDGIWTEKDFILAHGTLETVIKSNGDQMYKMQGRAELKGARWKEVEGINPLVNVRYLLPNYIFATLSDLGKDLPNYKEMYVPVEPSSILKSTAHNLQEQIKKHAKMRAKNYDNTITRHYINNPFNWVSIPIGENWATPTNLNDAFVLEKDLEILRIAKTEIAENRKVWIFTEFSGESGKGQYMQGKNIPQRLLKMFEAEGIKAFWLKPSVSPIDRKEKIESVKDDYDVFICNPKLVNVGINMAWCGTYIVYIPSYQVNMIEQGIHRGYRANSTIENRIFHMYYEGTVEEQILTRYQRKKAESAAIEGKFEIALVSEKVRTSSSLSKKISNAISNDSFSSNDFKNTSKIRAVV